MSRPIKMSAGAIDSAIAIPLDGLLSVQAGSVVSRTVAKGKSGTLTLMAFDTGEGLSEHSAPFDAYVQVISGSVELVIGGEPVKASAGELVLMPADVPHGLTALEPFVMLLTMFKEKK